MPTVKGILNFPNLFTAKTAKGATEPKFSCGVLLPANDPQIPAIQAEVDQAKLNTFPTGYTGSDECFGLYEVKIPVSKDYHDPRFVGWYLLTANAKADDRPAVVDMNRQPIIDPASVFGGMVGYISMAISGYTKGKGGVGGWLNGIMVTDEEPPVGRLDGKPSVDQMFANVNGAAPPAPAQLIMTAAANGMTYQQYLDAGWNDQQMIDGGVAQKPSFG